MNLSFRLPQTTGWIVDPQSDFLVKTASPKTGHPCPTQKSPHFRIFFPMNTSKKPRLPARCPLADVATLMDNFLRLENHALDHGLRNAQTAIVHYVSEVRILTAQLAILNRELIDSDRIIFEANQRAWDLQEQNQLFRERIQELETATTDPASSDTESEVLWQLNMDASLEEVDESE